MMYQYFLKIVPTEFDFINGKQTRTFQYSVSKQDQLVNQGGGLPGSLCWTTLPCASSIQNAINDTCHAKYTTNDTAQTGQEAAKCRSGF